MRSRHARRLALAGRVVLVAGTAAGAPPDAGARSLHPFQTEVDAEAVVFDMLPDAQWRSRSPGSPLRTSTCSKTVCPRRSSSSRRLHHGAAPQTTRPDPSSMNELRRAAQDPRARVFVLFLDPRLVGIQGAVRIGPHDRRAEHAHRRRRSDRGDDTRHGGARPHVSRRTGSIEQMLTPRSGHERTG